MFDKAFAGLFEHVEDLFKASFAAVKGIGDILGFIGGGEFGDEVQFGFLLKGGILLELVEDVAVGGEDKIKVVVVSEGKLLGAPG